MDLAAIFRLIQIGNLSMLLGLDRIEAVTLAIKRIRRKGSTLGCLMFAQTRPINENAAGPKLAQRL